MQECEYKLKLFAEPAPTTRDEPVSFEYEYRSDGFPLLKRMVSSSFNSQGQVTSEQINDFHLFLEDVPEQELTLSAFGFPEPSWATSTRSWWYLWLIAAAIVVGGSAFWFRRKPKLNNAA